jgi:hypothetical protein
MTLGAKICTRQPSSIAKEAFNETMNRLRGLARRRVNTSTLIARNITFDSGN